MKKLTIIVPIYNVEKYLNECLDSFVSQSSHDFTALLIDDGSTDNSSKIAKEYTQKYPELFIYHHQDNKGLGGARNTGIDLTESEYLMFFDSDDFMANRTVEHILMHIEKNPTDIIYFNPVIYDVVLKTYSPFHDRDLIKSMFAKADTINPSKTPMLQLSEASVSRAVWRTAFLKGIDLRFIEHIHWEDVPPHFYAIHNAKSASFLDYEGAYYYRINTGSQITAGNGKSRLDMETIFAAIEPYFKDPSWSKKEKIYMIGFLSNNILWHMRVIEDDYMAPFVEITHQFLKRIKQFGLYFSFYFRCKIGAKNKALIYCLKSNFYKKLKDKDYINSKMNLLKKIKKVLKK